MKQFIIAASLLSAMLFTTQTADAQSQHNNNQRQRNQRERIHHGYRSGQLTPREYNNLRRQQTDLHRLKRMARADGRITRGERRMLAHAQKRTSQNIYRQKHDGQKRYGSRGYTNRGYKGSEYGRNSQRGY